MKIDGLNVEIIVGLEIHVQLATATKMFCACRQEFGASPNSRTCPVCLGHPGSLPVMNRQAYEFSVRTALALNCTIAPFTKWDRKSYYYPDLPKNYQISQYDLPLSHDGWMDTLDGEGNLRRVRIIRAHLEEDAGKLLHEGNGPFSQVDLNRTGTPLLEIVTEPDMHSPAEVGNFGRELRRLVRHLGVSEANMQMGQMRLEPNVNCIIRADGKEFRTPIAEVKNLNSFKHVESAIAYEAERQVAQWRQTGAVLVSGNKSTRGWDPDRGVTVLQREKEEAHDYRYFPDPDLLPVVMDDAWLERIRATVVEMPLARRKRYVEQFGMDARDADQLIEERAICELFESAAAELPANLSGGSRRLVKVLLSEGAKRANERNVGLAELPISPARWAELVRLLEGGKISSSAAAAILDAMLAAPAADESAEAIAARLGLVQTSDASAIEPIIDELLAANPAIVADAKGAKGEKALGGLIGQVLKRVRGANPSAVREMFKKKLGLG